MSDDSVLSASVIIPTRNRAHIVPHTLRALAHQTLPHARFEVVVVDDGSTDGTETIVRATDYPFRLIYERLEPRAGFCPARPRNHGLRVAAGETAVLLDVDVLAHPGLIAHHLHIHATKPRPQAVIGYTYGFPRNGEERTPLAMDPPPPDRLLVELPRLLDEDQGRWGDGREPIYAATDDLARHPAPYQLFWTNNVSVPRALALEIGGFDERFVGWGGEDFEFAYRLFLLGVEFCLARQASGVHFPHEIGPATDRQAELVRNRRRLIAKHPNIALELQQWDWHGWAEVWDAVQRLAPAPAGFAAADTRSLVRLVRRLEEEVFAPRRLLWCGEAPAEVIRCVRPEAWCRPPRLRAGGGPGGAPGRDGGGAGGDRGGEDNANWPMALVGVFTPWEEGAFGGAVIVDYWRWLPSPVAAGVIREAVRVAGRAVLLATETETAEAQEGNGHGAAAWREAVGLLPSGCQWEMMRGGSLTALLVYQLPWRGKSWRPPTPAGVLPSAGPERGLARGDRRRAERRWVEALHEYGRVLQAGREVEPALEGVMEIAAQREDWEGALQATRALLARGRWHRTAWRCQWRALHRLGRTTEARAAAAAVVGGILMNRNGLQEALPVNGSGPPVDPVWDRIARTAAEEQRVNAVAEAVLRRIRGGKAAQPQEESEAGRGPDEALAAGVEPPEPELRLGAAPALPESEPAPDGAPAGGGAACRLPIELDRAPREAPAGRALGAHPLVAPLGTQDCEHSWLGRLPRKPWEYRITAVVPHLETPEPLRACVELLRLQTERPYILVIDTGSSESVKASLEGMRADDLEVHYVAAHGYLHSSEAVGVAQDLAFALCRTEYLFCTHADCFLRRRDYVEWLLSLCGPETPAVGYQMSPRDWITDLWEGMVSHTATLLHMPTMHRLGVTWSFERAHVQFEIPREQACWPDTETCMNLCLRAAGVKPLLIKSEENFKRNVDENLDHVRSYPGSLVFKPEYHARAKVWMEEALREAWQRVIAWRAAEIPMWGSASSRTTGLML